MVSSACVVSLEEQNPKELGGGMEEPGGMGGNAPEAETCLACNFPFLQKPLGFTHPL